MSRWFRFLIAILFGIGLGLAYGWFLSPSQHDDTALDTLRIDYKTDFVLMVAEAYQNEGDLEAAVHRLTGLGEAPPATIVEQSIQFAQNAGYTEPDISRIQTLLSALQANIPNQGNPAQ